MSKHTFSKILKITAATAAVGFGAAELLWYMMSNRNGNVDFLWGDGSNESEKDRKIRLRREEDYDWISSQPLEHYYIYSDDGLKLHASLLKATLPTDRYAFCVHGYRCHGTKEFDSIARFYHSLGLNVFMIDHRASGQSEGKYITYGAKEHEDCLKWLDFMIDNFGSDIRIFLHGCSMGSATVMMLCGCDLPDNVKFAVSDCGYSSLKSQLLNNFSQYKLPRYLCYTLYRLAALWHGDFDPADVNPVLSMERCRIPAIIVHGEADDFIDPLMARSAYAACPVKAKKLIMVPEASHVQSFQLSDEYKDSIKEYIDKYMS